MTGRSKGTIYTHAYFSTSVERTLASDNFGDTCAGLTCVTLTAFMVESYLNYLCENIYDYECRVNTYLDNNKTDNIINMVSNCKNKDLYFKSRLAESLGYTYQAEIMIKSLSSNIKGKKKEQFENDLVANKNFSYFEREYKFQTSEKLKAVLKACQCEKSQYDRWLQEHNKLFRARHSLVHGKTENVNEEFEVIEGLEISDAIQTVTASWQKTCSLNEAQKMYDLSKNLINYLNKQFLNELLPLSKLSTQISAVS